LSGQTKNCVIYNDFNSIYNIKRDAFISSYNAFHIILRVQGVVCPMRVLYLFLVCGMF